MSKDTDKAPCRAFSEAEERGIGEVLSQKLGKSLTATRPGNAGHRFTYVESWRVIELANEIFGFNGWSCHVIDVCPDYGKIDEKNGKYEVGVTAIVKVTLKDGTCHEDCGYGIGENPKKGAAIEKAKKEAVTDARKRALRLFGAALGNCLYSKQHVRQMQHSSGKGGKGYLQNIQAVKTHLGGNRHTPYPLPPRMPVPHPGIPPNAHKLPYDPTVPQPPHPAPQHPGKPMAAPPPMRQPMEHIGAPHSHLPVALEKENTVRTSAPVKAPGPVSSAPNSGGGESGPSVGDDAFFESMMLQQADLIEQRATDLKSSPYSSGSSNASPPEATKPIGANANKPMHTANSYHANAAKPAAVGGMPSAGVPGVRHYRR